MIIFTVFGEPVAQGRPRAARMGNEIRMHDPEKSRNYKSLVYGEAIQVKPSQLLDGELQATIRAFFSIPKSKGKRWQMDADLGHIRPIKKPDSDNIAKIILDSCNGVLYRDDSQVVRLVVEKKYSHNPRVEVEIDTYRAEW